MERDEDSMFGNANHIIRACSLAFLVFLFILLIIAIPAAALIIIGIVFIGSFCFLVAYVIGLFLGWWDYVW